MSTSSVVAVLFHRDGLVLAVSRKQDHADLGLPGGAVEEGESFEEAALRETLEEIGVEILQMREVFDHPDSGRSARTFQVDAFNGDPRSVEGAWVGWVAPAALLQPHCSFRDYNRALFEAVGLI